MTTTCKRLQSLLFRVAEGEASPREGLSVARHLTDCTACRILLAREHRLAAMLETGLADALPIGEDFVRTVMARLPEAPPRRRRSKLHGLKLASLAGLFLAASLAALRIEQAVAPGGAWPAFPRGSSLPLDLGVTLATAVDALGAAVLGSTPALAAALAGSAALLLLLGLSAPAASATPLDRRLD